MHPLAGTPDLLTSIGHRSTVWGLFGQISPKVLADRCCMREAAA
ncbi:hypothetical protein ACFVIN_03505 [Streptomyces prasinus]